MRQEIEAKVNEEGSEGVWVFGYGSLIWKVDFPVEERRVGYIKGFERRFWQKSHDHRGTPEKPGYVVTLVENEQLAELEKSIGGQSKSGDDGKCYGVVYRIKKGLEKEVLDHLDHREKDGYTVHKVCVYSDEPRDGSEEEHVVVKEALVYIGQAENSSFAGPVTNEEVARVIANTIGLSGTNQEYLFNLCEALRGLTPSHMLVDDHLLELEGLVHKFIMLEYCISV
ncbi:putative glutathione-specific gamma-glutamylcyclotransferase 2 [Zancudomyces culisetae]|uniref:glutathione-specific gamma-glutamylcyclotransferase n=1 Tax=Zancudomyces culisetae TaxID=1213189 RepID=A0A1R1PS73_ZANCU|nr:putative glutathione-specific gamma-glutamylcyclotransferase 2 [Zancudomyces culisetae]|eukprot:OMH83743.1 putative glutathione-specific gamma-glutamylcyclotransferase 2 [Zancudomyces culisetae]